MHPRVHRYLQALILFGLSLFVLWKWLNGTLNWYINSRYLWLSLLAILGMLGMAGVVIASAHEPPHHHDHAEEDPMAAEPLAAGRLPLAATLGVLILVIPLLIGLAIPARPLSAGSVANKGISVSAPLTSSVSKTTDPAGIQPTQRTILDWIKLFNYQTDLSPFLGQKAHVTGFVYHDAHLPPGHFMVGRFVITCCVADAFAIGMAVQADPANQWADNTWVDVLGSVQSIEFNNQKIPLIIVSSIQKAQEPSQPYLFP